MLADGFLTIASVKSLSASSKFPVREGNILISVKKKEKQAKSAYKPAFYYWEERDTENNNTSCPIGDSCHKFSCEMFFTSC